MSIYVHANPSAVLESIKDSASWEKAAMQVKNIPNYRICVRWKSNPEVVEFLKTAGSEVIIDTKPDLTTRRYRVTLRCNANANTCYYEY